MELIGYQQNSESEKSYELSGLYISAAPEALRAIASFLLDAAAEMDELGADFGHLHFMDHWPQWKGGTPDIQVLRPKFL